MYALANLPQFLRFDCVKLHYQNSVYVYTPLIEKTCQSAVNYLQRFKLNDSSLIHFNGTISKNNPSYFSDHSKLLDHLRNELLPIHGSSRRYKFEICFHSNSDQVSISYADLFVKILQIPRIDCCSNVEIKFNGFTWGLPINFPIEPISNWLHKSCDGIKEKSKERFLRIYPFSFLCARELCNHLKKVTILFIK